MGTSDKNAVFGCDIGNGFGFISVLEDTKTDPVPMFPPKFRLEKTGMPTSAYIAPPTGDVIEVFDGRAAYDKHKGESDKFIHAVKTRLKAGRIPIPGIKNPVDVDAVYAAIARDLVRLGNEERVNRGKEPVYEIVFTFPASFTEDVTLLNRMQKSIESVKLDGHEVKVAGRLPEPAAVAIDYLYYMQNIAPSDVRLKGDSYTALVYDLGYGTFDVAVVTARSKGEPYKLHINEGLPDVGGKDFDAVLYDEICRSLKNDYGYTPKNSNARDVIRRTAIEMKHELTDSDRSSREILLSGGETAEVEITREKFEEKSRGLINRTFELVDRVIQRAKSERIKIDSVVLSGGASQMPMVISGLEQLLDDEDMTLQVYRPSEAVSYGAARYAYGRSKKTPLPDPVLEKYTEYCYGIWLPSESSLAGEVKVLVESGRKLPAASGSITLRSSDSLRLRLYRSKEKYVTAEALDVEEQCESLMFFPFDVPANTECEVKIEVQEDYNVKIMCRPVHGTLIEKSTMDKL